MLTMPMMDVPPEPSQALSLNRFHAALAFHGFVAEVGMLDLTFIDRRLLTRYAGATIRKAAPDGRIFIDRLATLEALLGRRRETVEARRARRILWRRLASASMALMAG